MTKHWWVALLAVGAVACGQAPQASTRQSAAAAEQAATQAATQPAAGAEAAAAAGTNGEVAESNVVYVDVRTPEEFAEGHVAGAINIPHTEIAQRYPELRQYEGKELVLYCRSGRRAGIAERVLEDIGFQNVRNAGGLTDLEAEGVPVTR